MSLEEIDSDYWRDVKVLTVWQAAFLMCDVEPWDEPISANSKPPQKIEAMRGDLLEQIGHYQTGDAFSKSGWSCKLVRPMQLSGLYFSRSSLINWASLYLSVDHSVFFSSKI